MTLLICGVVAAAAIVLVITQLEFRSDRSELVDPDLPWNKRYLDYKKQFLRWGDVVICLDGDPANEAVDDLTRTISGALADQPQIDACDGGFQITEVNPRMFRAARDDLFQSTLNSLGEARRITAAANANAALNAMLESQADDAHGASAHELQRILRPYFDAIEGRAVDFGFLAPDLEQWQPLISPGGEGRLRFIRVQFAGEQNGVGGIGAQLKWLRGFVRDQIARAGVSDVEWGVTGVTAIEADETSQSIVDSTRASIVAAVLIIILMLIVFRGGSAPLLAAAALLVGVAWSFGWLILAVGHLQLLSMVFSVILLGLGVDFALHMLARLELVRDEHEHVSDAVSRVFRGIGPGMLTGAITTAAAFGSTAFSDFTGMKEMGVISAGGIVLCLIAVLCVFPAALALSGKRWKRIIRHRAGGETAHFAHGRLDVVDEHPHRSLAIAGVVVALMALAAPHVRYDANVLNLHPPGIESVRWEERIVEEDARGAWAALTVTTPEQAAALTDAMRALPEVSDVGGMGILYPADRAQRDAAVAEVRGMPIAAASAPPGFARTLPVLKQAGRGLRARAAIASGADVIAPLRARADRIDAVIELVESMDAAERESRWTALNESFIQSRDVLRGWVDDALTPGALTIDHLPPFIRHIDVGTNGTWLLRVYPAEDPQGRSILHPDRLEAFVSALKKVDGEVIGPPVQIFESSRIIVRSYILAAAYAIATILIILLLDFRSLADALCSMIPVSVGFLGAFALMAVFDVPLNFANIIVMPLIFGIGVDAGVHMVHRWRDEPFGRPAGLSGGTGRGITLTMITTMIGFGCLLLAHHRGIRSLGFVMLIGLFVTLMACYGVLPAVLQMRGGKRGVRVDAETD